MTKKDFITEVVRCPQSGSCTLDTGTIIGKRNSIGQLVLNDTANDTERKYYNKLNKQTKNQANNSNVHNTFQLVYRCNPSTMISLENTTINQTIDNFSEKLLKINGSCHS